MWPLIGAGGKEYIIHLGNIIWSFTLSYAISNCKRCWFIKWKDEMAHYMGRLLSDRVTPSLPVDITKGG